MEQIDKNVRETWDYARGKRLEWKRAGRIPGGLDYDVLTVDGVKELYPCPTSIETSQRKVGAQPLPGKTCHRRSPAVGGGGSGHTTRTKADIDALDKLEAPAEESQYAMPDP